MNELFDRLLESIVDAQETSSRQNALPSSISNTQAINDAWGRVQDSLNDYIDKRIELANRK